MERLFTEDLGNSLIVRGHWETAVNGKREEREVFIVDVEFQGQYGRVTLERDLEWPHDGIEWDEETPVQWESLESDVQDWIDREIGCV